MAQDINFKQWDEQPAYTNSFKMVSKYTDLGSADGKKSLLGIILNVSLGTESTSTSPSIYNFTINYRKGPADEFSYLATFNNVYYSGVENKGNIEIIKLFPEPVKNIHNIQLEIKGLLRNDINLNDFGLIFRTYRDSNVVSLDE